MATTPAEDLSLRETVAELEAVTIELERRGLTDPDFGLWQTLARPDMDWGFPHFRYIFDHLDRVTASEIKRVLFQVAIRHGKTETMKGYCAYRLELDPTTRILFATHNQTTALAASRDVRRMIRDRGVELSDEASAASAWETQQRGKFRALGVGTGTASLNADLIVIDDPIGGRKEAESEAHRNAVWDWLRMDILARAEPHTAVLFSMPRWHHDDPAGRAQEFQADQWTVVDLPGIAEPDDPLGREEGELLWPEYRPDTWIEDKRVELGSYGFAAAVQCRPSPREGGMFKWAWMEPHFVNAAPNDVVQRVRYWDTAGTEGGGDYTAGCRMSLGSDGLYYIEDMVRGQWAPGHRDGEIKDACDEDARLPGRYKVGVEQESGINGKKRTRAIVKQLSGHSVQAEPATGSKEYRADPVASQMEVGNVKIVKGAWNRDFYDELLQFPNGNHDDQVDAMSGAFSMLAEGPGKASSVPFRIA